MPAGKTPDKTTLPMLLDDRPYTFDRVFRLLASVAVIAAVIWLLQYLSDVLIPFAAAFLIAYLLNPLVNRIQKKIANRAAAVLTALLIVLVSVSCLLAVSAPLVKNEITRMSQLIVDVAQNSDLASRASEHLPDGVWEHIQNMARGREVQQLRELLSRQDVWAVLQAAAKKMLPGVWRVIHGAASLVFGLLGLFIVVLYVVFMLLDYQRLTQEWHVVIPPAWHDAVVGFLDDFNAGMHRYFRAQALVASLVGLLFALGFWLIGLPLAILMGLFVGLLNMVPYLQTIGLVPAGLLAVVMALETDRGIWLSLGLTLSVFAIVQLIQDTVLTPRIMGRVTGLSPALILLSLSIWGKLLGMLGLIIALPMTCLLLAYYRRLIAPPPAAD